MAKIILLSRVSTGQQSLDSQTKDLIREAKRLGYDEQNQIIIETVESAIKLSEEERLGLIQLKQYIETDKEVDCVIIWEPSRLSRQQKTLFSIRDYLVENKIQLYILNPYAKLLTDDRERMDTTANIVFSLFSTISENEMMLKKERFARARAELKRQGLKNSGATVFGYIKNKNKKCIPHPLHSKIIIDIYNHYINCESSLYETYTYASGKWPELFPMMDYVKCQHKIRHILDKPVYYKGDWCYEPLVTEEMWNKVHEKMANARSKARYQCKREFLCRGKMVCGHCGYIMTGAGGNMKAYICSKDKQHNMQINWDAMDWLIWEETRVAVNINSSFEDTQKKNELIETIKQKDNIISGYEKSLKDINIKKSKLLDIYIKGSIDNDLFNKKNDELLNIESDLLNKLNKQKVEQKSLMNVLENTQNELLKPKSINVDSVEDFETRQELVRKYISKMIVTKDKDNDRVKHIRFEYTFPVIIPKCQYRYESKNQYKKIYRINEDLTEDLIYDEHKQQKRDKNGNFVK